MLEEKGYGWIRDEVAAAAHDGASPVPHRRREFPILAREGLRLPRHRRPRRRRARPAIEAMDRYYETTARSIHRGVYPIAAEATDAYEGARATVAAFAGSTAERDDLHPQRDRGDQPRRLRVGAARTSGPATSW